MKSLHDKQVAIFDLDGTLAKSKAPADKEMLRLLLELLQEKNVAVIGGGRYELFKEQLIDRLPRRDERFERLFFFPKCSTAFYRFKKGKWTQVYALELSAAERANIKKAFAATFKKIGYERPPKTYGSVIDDRRTQVTFSALGQDIVGKLGARRGLALKEEWHEKSDIRPLIMKELKKLLPRFEVRLGGLTSIDVTRKGIDKAYGVRQISKELRMPIRKMVFVGDALFPGGNDYAAKKTGIDCIAVRDPEDTKKVIRQIIGGK